MQGTHNKKTNPLPQRFPILVLTTQHCTFLSLLVTHLIQIISSLEESSISCVLIDMTPPHSDNCSLYSMSIWQFLKAVIIYELMQGGTTSRPMQILSKWQLLEWYIRSINNSNTSSCIYVLNTFFILAQQKALRDALVLWARGVFWV